LVLDLDNRINLWLASATASRGGYGPNEVNSGGLGTPASELASLNQMRYGGSTTPNANRLSWTLTEAPALGGTFQISVGNPVINTTPPILYNATAAVIQTALEAVVGVGNVIATGGPINVRPVVIRFAPIAASVPITVDATQLLNSNNVMGGAISV